VTDQRLLAAQLFNETWRLMELQGRSRLDDDRMIHTAHASRYHWGQVPAATPGAPGQGRVADLPCLHGPRAARARAAPRPQGPGHLPGQRHRGLGPCLRLRGAGPRPRDRGGRRAGQAVHRPGPRSRRGHRRRRWPRPAARWPGDHSRPATLLV